MQSLSSFYSIKTYSFSALYTTIPHPKLKDRLMDQVFHEKDQPTQKQIPRVRQGHILFCKKKQKHYDSAKKFSENDIISMLVFLIDKILLMFGGRNFNRKYAYLWVQIVLLFSPACSFIPMGQTSQKDLSRKTKRSQPDALFSHPAILMMSFH